MLIYMISITYPNSEEIEDLNVELGVFNLFDSADMQKKKNKLFGAEVKEIHKRATDAGFEIIEDEDDKDLVVVNF